MKKILLSLAAGLVSMAGMAQVSVTPAADNPFNFSAGKSYVCIYLGDETRGEVGMADDSYIYFGPDADNGRNLWSWDQTFEFPETADVNSFFIPGEYMSVRVASTWSGLGYAIAAENPVNLSFIDSNWGFHFAVRTQYEGPIAFKITDGKGTEAAIVLGNAPYENDPAVANFPRDNEWYNIDVPMSWLEDQFEFTFDGDTRYADKNYFVVLGGGVEGTIIDYDAVFFHGPKVSPSLIDEVSADAIGGVKADAAADAPIYDLTGRRVAKATKGIYLVGGKKVYVK